MGAHTPFKERDIYFWSQATPFVFFVWVISLPASLWGLGSHDHATRQKKCCVQPWPSAVRYPWAPAVVRVLKHGSPAFQVSRRPLRGIRPEKKQPRRGYTLSACTLLKPNFVCFGAARGFGEGGSVEKNDTGLRKHTPFSNSSSYSVYCTKVFVPQGSNCGEICT